MTAVPVKCDICKNVTINCNNDNFGFVHSAWYPKLYPRATCHSIIENKPDHMIVVYSVSGSIGLDRIQLQSFDTHGYPVNKEILTGNLTTQLVLKSAHDVNVTVLPLDGYYSSQRRFLLYFYIVPKCYLILCPNITVYPQSTRPLVSEVTTSIFTTISTTKCESITPSTPITIPSTAPLSTTTTTKFIVTSYASTSTYDHRIPDNRPRISGFFYFKYFKLC